MLSVLYKALATIYYDSVKEINHGGEFTLFYDLQKMFKTNLSPEHIWTSVN